MNRIFIGLFAAACFLVFFSCQKEYSFEQGNILPAAGSLWDSTGACLPSVVYGTYYNGVTPGTDTDYVEIQVNVTQTGSYNIETEAENGFFFTDSGFFSSTGINIVRLKPSGVPIIPTTSTFTFSFDSTYCTFSVTTKDSTGTGLGGGTDTSTVTTDTWKFATDSGGNFSGAIYNATMEPDTLSDGTTVDGYILNIIGLTGTTDSLLVLNILYPDNNITTGTFSTLTYNSDSSRASVFGFCPNNGNDCFYFAQGAFSDPNIEVKITISSYDATTKVVTGSFSGVAYNANNAAVDPNSTIKIQNGEFSAVVQ